MAGTGRLPGMTDAQIEELDGLAEEYKKYQRKRQAALNKEITLKADLMAAMKKHKKKLYIYEDISIEVVPGEESIKVKTAKKGDDEEEAA